MKDEMKIISVKKHFYNDVYVDVEFEKRGKKANFTYTLIGDETGIDQCNYIEDEDEDIYADIHDWIYDNIEVNVDVLFNGEFL